MFGFRYSYHGCCHVFGKPIFSRFKRIYPLCCTNVCKDIFSPVFAKFLQMGNKANKQD